MQPLMTSNIVMPTWTTLIKIKVDDQADPSVRWAHINNDRLPMEGLNS